MLILAVGLPVASIASGARARGTFRSSSHRQGATVTVDVVKVFAQPVGALLAASVGNEALRHLQAARTLIVDAGWRTFDWVVTSGAKIHDTRSDSVARSMFEVVDAIGQGGEPGPRYAAWGVRLFPDRRSARKKSRCGSSATRFPSPISRWRSGSPTKR
jgi:hypothetical protein